MPIAIPSKAPAKLPAKLPPIAPPSVSRGNRGRFGGNSSTGIGCAFEGSCLGIRCVCFMTQKGKGSAAAASADSGGEACSTSASLPGFRIRSQTSCDDRSSPQRSYAIRKYKKLLRGRATCPTSEGATGIGLLYPGIAKANGIVRCWTIRRGEALHQTSSEESGRGVASPAGILGSASPEASGIPNEVSSQTFDLKCLFCFTLSKMASSLPSLSGAYRGQFLSTQGSFRAKSLLSSCSQE